MRVIQRYIAIVMFLKVLNELSIPLNPRFLIDIPRKLNGIERLNALIRHIGLGYIIPLTLIVIPPLIAHPMPQRFILGVNMRHIAMSMFQFILLQLSILDPPFLLRTADQTPAEVDVVERIHAFLRDAVIDIPATSHEVFNALFVHPSSQLWVGLVLYRYIAIPMFQLVFRELPEAFVPDPPVFFDVAQGQVIAALFVVRGKVFPQVVFLAVFVVPKVVGSLNALVQGSDSSACMMNVACFDGVLFLPKLAILVLVLDSFLAWMIMMATSP